MGVGLEVEFQRYLDNNKHPFKLTKEQLNGRTLIPVTRQFTFESGDVEDIEKSGKEAFFGGCYLTVEDAFSEMFLKNKIHGFTGYRVTELPTAFGVTFRIDTEVVIATDEEWDGY